MKILQAEYTLIGHEVKKDLAIVIDSDSIVALISKAEAQERIQQDPSIESIVWRNRVVVPGTINIHNHCFQSLLRGKATDEPFLVWRDSMYKFAERMTLDDIYNGAVFAFAEMMKRGVTTVTDFFYLHTFGRESDEAIIRAAKDVGIRLVLARTMYDWDGAPKGFQEDVATAVENTRALALKYKDDPMVDVLPAPHSLHAATPEMIVAGHKLAKELGTKFHIHVAEEPFEVDECLEAHGMRTIEYLDHLGVVDESMVIVHGVYLSDEEVALLGRKGGNLAYCPSSNMFLADGITDIPHMIKSGVNIALGSDGACSNNRISVFEEMRMVSILQKAATCDALCVNYRQSYDMGTKNGGQILDKPIGDIRQAYKADLVGIDLEDLSMMPIGPELEQVLPNIVYSMEPTAIKEVMVGGRMTVTDGKTLTIEDEHVRQLVRETVKRIGL